MNGRWIEKNKKVTRATIVQKKEDDLDVVKSHFGNEVRRRLPWIFVSILAGIIMIWVGQSFESTLFRKTELIFFIPMIVYMSDSIGTETLALFIRELALKRFSMKHLIIKESLVGLFLGFASGASMGLFSYIWFEDTSIAAIVAIAMTINGILAVLIGMTFPMIFHKFNLDPALGTDELTTAVSDNLSMLIYFVVSTAIILGA